MKRGHLSKVEHQQILEYIKDGKSIEKISELMDRSIKIISDFAEKNPTKTEITQRTDSVMPTAGPSKLRLANKTVGGNKGVNIMTKESSEIADEARKHIAKTMPKGAFKIFDE
jgi:hypothetical protein